MNSLLKILLLSIALSIGSTGGTNALFRCASNDVCIGCTGASCAVEDEACSKKTDPEKDEQCCYLSENGQSMAFAKVVVPDLLDQDLGFIPGEELTLASREPGVWLAIARDWPVLWPHGPPDESGSRGPPIPVA